MNSGVVLSTPVPDEAALPEGEVQGWITQALQEAANMGVRGKAITPFLLARVQTLSEGRSLVANQALVMNNARVGARLARALHELQNKPAPAKSPAQG